MDHGHFMEKISKTIPYPTPYTKEGFRYHVVVAPLYIKSLIHCSTSIYLLKLTFKLGLRLQFICNGHLFDLSTHWSRIE
jgi:hypothetical protein